MTLFDRQIAGHTPFQKRFESLADVNTRGPVGSSRHGSNEFGTISYLGWIKCVIVFTSFAHVRAQTAESIKTFAPIQDESYAAHPRVIQH
jgi:hypothetical protein